MKVLVTGSTGFIGSALVPHLVSAGHEVSRLVRTPPKPGGAEVRWDPASGIVETGGLDGVDAVVHLAGESIATGRWTAEKKARIRESRVRGTAVLAESLARLAQPPRTLVCASAIGYYGDRGDQVLTEESPPGSGFLADVCREWEAAADPARTAGIRVVNLRIGVVLSRRGGALAQMLRPFLMGVGGKLGSGRQYMSWIALDDLLRAAAHVLATEALSGPVNAVAPNPVTNVEFTRALGHILGRPTLFSIPAFAVRCVFGEMGDEVLLASARVEPRRLIASGYRFRYAELEDALRHVLGRP
jgi:uncharacterized protein (TIGR01777 family)